jgi:beta-lactamase class A
VSTSTTLETGTTTSVVPTVTTLPQQSQLSQEVNSVLDHREGNIEAAVQNLTTDVTTDFGPESPQDEASVVKVNILATMLSAVSTTLSLSAQDRTLAQEMIEASDNDAATLLWNAVGGSLGISAFDKRVGLTATTPSPCVECANFPWPGWGLTTTTPLDEIKLLRAVFVDDTYMSAEDRMYQLRLMRSVIPSERWGISYGVPNSVSVALKNGWLPLNNSDTDWQINSVGWVRGDGQDYLVAIFSTGNPNEEYGIQTLDTISSEIWKYIGT